MIPELMPLVLTTVNWESYLPAAQQFLERSVTAAIDAKRLPVGDLASFIGSLAELQREGSDPELAIHVPRFRNHLWFSFLVASDHTLLPELRELNLSLLSAGGNNAHYVGVLSGTLSQWQIAVEEILTEAASRDARILFGKIYLWLVQQGLGPSWAPKQDIGDGTFILRRK